MYGLMGSLSARKRVLGMRILARMSRFRVAMRDDRGETGPLGYAIMVSTIVLLAIFVAAWGEDVARHFMERVEDVPVGEVGGGGDSGGGGGGDQ